ncbi:MAG: hypothetical protein M0R06_25355 [Sphaerochaeta sp.]|jgi:hypothetical protein|nr:hypothetical protein [Sphaerochaeta sp.]
MFSQDPAYAQFLQLLADILLAGAQQESAPAQGPERRAEPAPTAKSTQAGTHSVAQAA